MEPRDLEGRLLQLQTERQAMVANFRETAQALVERIQHLEQQLGRPSPAVQALLASLPAPACLRCPNCSAQQRSTAMHYHNFTCGKVEVRSAVANPLEEAVRAALQADDVTRVKKLVAQGLELDHYFLDTGYCTAHAVLLHEAIKAGAMKATNYLRSQRVDLNALTAQGESAVVLSRQTLAAELNQCDPLCVLLQQSRGHIDLEHVNKQGLTAIQIAVKNGEKEIVGLLSEHGANVNVVNGLGDTLIQMAQRAGHQEVVMLLVNVGAPLR